MAKLSVGNGPVSAKLLTTLSTSTNSFLSYVTITLTPHQPLWGHASRSCVDAGIAYVFDAVPSLAMRAGYGQALLRCWKKLAEFDPKKNRAGMA